MAFENRLLKNKRRWGNQIRLCVLLTLYNPFRAGHKSCADSFGFLVSSCIAEALGLREKHRCMRLARNTDENIHVGYCKIYWYVSIIVIDQYSSSPHVQRMRHLVTHMHSHAAVAHNAVISEAYDSILPECSMREFVNMHTTNICKMNKAKHETSVHTNNYFIIVLCQHAKATDVFIIQCANLCKCRPPEVY